MKSSLKKILPAFIALLLFISCEQTPADFLNKLDFFNEPKRFKSEQEFNDSKLEFTEQSQNGYSFVILFNPEKDNELLLDNSFRIYYSHKIDSEYKVTLETLNQEPLTYEVIDKSPLVITLNEQDKQSVLQNGLVIKYKGIQINNILNSSDESESNVLSVEKESLGEGEKNNNDILSDRTVVFEHNGSEWQKDIQISNYAVNQAGYHAGQYLELTVTGVPDADVNEILFDTYKNYPGETWYGTRLNGMENSTYLGLFNLRKGKQFNCTTLIKCAEDGNTNSSGIIMCYAFGTGDGWSSDWGWSTNQFDGQLTIKDFTISVRVYDNPLHWNIAYDPNLKKQTLYIDCDSAALPYFNTAYFDGWSGSDAPWTGHESEYSAVVFGDNIEVITNAFYFGHTVNYIRLPANVKVLGIDSFFSTRSLVQLYIPASVEYIGYHSFMKWSGCTQYLDWPESENSSRILTGLEYDNEGTYLNKQNHMTLTPVSEGVKINVDVSDLIVDNLAVVDLDTGTGISITPEYINLMKTDDLIYPFCNANQEMRFQLHGNVKHSEYEDYSWFYEDVTVTSAGGVGPLNYSGFDQIKLNYTEEGERGRYLSAADFTVDNISLMFSNFLNGSTYMENLHTELKFVSGKTDWSNGTFWLTGMQNDLQYLQEDCLTYKLLDGQKVDIFEPGLWWDSYTAAEFNNKLSQNPTLYFGMLIGFRLSNYNNGYIQIDNGPRIYASQFITKELQFEYDYTPVIINSFDSGNGYSFTNGTLTITDSVDADFFNNKSFSPEDITTLNIHNNVQTIPSDLFTKCKNLEAVNVSSPLEKIESEAFQGLTKLKIVNIPDSVKSIGARAFYNCSSLECIVIPENTVSIGEMAFASSGIKILLVQENVQSIGAGAFQNCSSLEVVYIHENSKLQSFSSYLFSNCESLYQISVYIEADTYQSSGFKITSCYLNDLGTISMPSSINEIGYRAFYNCKNITQVNIFSPVTSINSEAFLGTGITSVIIPSSVTSIGEDAFPRTCSVYVDWYEEQALEHEVDSTVNVIYKPRNQYSFNNGSLELNQNIGSSFFTDNQINSSEVTNIIIGKNVTVIDNETFKQCKNLTAVDFSQSENLTEIGEKAFYGCPVEEIDLSGCKYLTTIGNYAFSNCAGLTTVTIPESVKKLGSYTFSTCSSLIEVVFSGTSSLTELGSSTFYNCKQLQNLTLPDTIKGLGGYNFYGCINLPSIILSEGVAESQYDGQGINGDNNFSGWPKNHPVYLNYTREQDHNSSRRYGDATIVYKDEKVIIVEYISDNGTAGILESYASGASSQSSLMQVSSANKEFGGWYTEPELINKVEDVPGLFRLQQSAATSDNTNPLTGGVVVRLKLYAEWKDLQ